MPNVVSKPCSDVGCSCICGECTGCQCECHRVDHVPNPILKKVLNEQGVSFNELANMTRNQLFHKMKEQDEPLKMLINALTIYNVRKSHYGEHDTEDAILRRIARTNAPYKKPKASRKSMQKKAARKSASSGRIAARKSASSAKIDQCET